MKNKSVLLYLVVLLTGAAPTAWSDRPWYQDYEEALDRLKRGDARGAILLLEKTLRTGPDPGPQRPTYGMHFMDFFPYLHLARAYLQMGQCDRAQEFLERSARLDRLPPDLQATELRPLRQQIQAQCIPPAKTPAPPAARPAESPPAEKEAPASQPSAPSPTQPKGPATEAPPVGPSVPPTRRPVPAAVLQTAWRAYLRGDYDGAYRVLQDARRQYELDDTAYFILGCSRAARYFREGGADGRLLDEARRYLRQARQLPPELQKRLALFISPKILALYGEHRRAGGGE